MVKIDGERWRKLEGDSRPGSHIIHSHLDILEMLKAGRNLIIFEQRGGKEQLSIPTLVDSLLRVNRLPSLINAREICNKIKIKLVKQLGSSTA